MTPNKKELSNWLNSMYEKQNSTKLIKKGTNK